MSKKIVALFATAAAVYGGLVYASSEAAAFGQPSSADPYAWVCETLDREPTVDGMWSVIYGGVSRGQTSNYDAEQIVKQVKYVCPRHIPVVLQWAEENE